MIEFIRVPYEGCDWSEVEVLTPEEFKAACERGPTWDGRIPTPCALGWSYERTGVEAEGFCGLVYDYRVARTFGGDGSKGWRAIGNWHNP